MKAYETDCNLDRICGMSNYDHIFGGPIANTQFHITGNMPITTPQPPTVEKVDSMTIAEFLEARIAEDEAAAKAASESARGAHWSAQQLDYEGLSVYGDEPSGRIDFDSEGELPTLRYLVRFDPARALAECAAKRAILEFHGPLEDKGWISGKDNDYLWCGSCGTLDDSPTPYPCETLQVLAAVYKDHPDYQQEWAL